jgi:ABC-type multidrug transport system fused ATPase/permease subunit
MVSRRIRYFRSEAVTEKRVSIYHILKDLFPPKERWRVGGVLGLTAIAALFETVGVASILPFMALVVDPVAINRFGTLRKIAYWFGATSPHGTLLVFGIITVSIIAVGNAIGALNVWVLQRFLARTQARLATFLFDGYMKQPYAFHVHRDAPSLIKVMGDAGTVVYGVVSPTLGGGSRALVGFGVLALLFVRTPLMSIAVIGVLAGAYYAAYRLVQERQRIWGSEYRNRSLDYMRVVQEAFGGVKELQVLGREGLAIERQRTGLTRMNYALAANTTIAQVPRYLLETIAFGGILMLAVLLVVRGGTNSREIIPILALYAFAGFRLMPALQNVFAAAVGVRFTLPTVWPFHEDYMQIVQARSDEKVFEGVIGPEIEFKEAIRIKEISFSYPNSNAEALREVDLTIRPFETVGLVGRTGAGKTTLADLILGLYEPTAGTITIDGVALTGPAIRSWRKHVGYVSQHVFLANASITENIALGLHPDAIDPVAIRRAASLAQAVEFISRLPAGFDTIVGERGVKLSGGQRQRIGVARALYHEPQVLVFDEATSALDGLTEDSLMEAIRSLSGERTIILIAHRMRTVEACQRIIVLESGNVIGDGSYDELLRDSEEFRKMVGRATSRAGMAAGVSGQSH